MMTLRNHPWCSLPHWLTLVLLCLPSSLFAVTEDELLEPDAAFQFRAEAVPPDRIRVHWKIADGYYMYRSRIKFHSESDGIDLGEPDLPQGKVKHDEFFGDIEIYRKQVDVDVPVQRAADGSPDIRLVAVSQGCADLGVCYPPLTQVAELSLAALDTPAPAKTPAPGPLAGLVELGEQLGLGGQDEFLDPDVAFQLSTEVLDAHTLLVNLQIADGYYLYRDKFKFETDSPDITLLPASLPPGEVKEDPLFGRVEVYHNDAEARIPLRRDTLNAVDVPIKITYQGCAEAGICYTPQEKTVAFALPVAEAAEPPAGAAPETVLTLPASAPTSSAQPVSEQDRLARMLTEKPLWFSMFIFFGLGLGLAFTPCVFPMIPILSSIIVGQGKHLTTSHAFVLSLVYVLAVAVTYTVAGIAAALFGGNLQAAFQNPWILSSFAIVFVVLALSMFGFYELQMPSSLQSRLNEISTHQKSGTLFGVAVMGFLSALIVGPCVAAPLIGALLVIGQTGDVVLGGSALFALSLGMGAPLLAIGTGFGKILPKAGPWMDATKAVFGVLLLAVAIWMLERILPPALTMGLWAALLIASAVYMGALDSLAGGASGWRRLWKALGLVLLVWGALLLIGVAGGSRDTLQPLRGVFVGSGTSAGVQTDAHLPFKRIKSVADLEREVSTASAAGKPVMLDFYADWCISCKEMEKFTFSDPRVHQALANAVLLQADVTANDEEDKALLKHYDLLGPPTIIFYGPDAQERRAYRVVGYMKVNEFLQHLAGALGQ